MAVAPSSPVSGGFTVLCLMETWLRSENSTRLCNYQYPPARKDRLDRERGGVAIFVRQGIPCLTIDVQSDMEVVAVETFIEINP